MTKYEKLAKELQNPKPATKKPFNPADYFGYSAGFDHTGNPEPRPMRQASVHSPTAPPSELEALIAKHSKDEPPDPNWFKEPRSQELMKLLGLETAPDGSPILGDSDDKLMESGKGYLSKDPTILQRSELLERLLIGDEFADQYYKKP